MNKKKVPFPRYLNAKKLFYIWEYDVVLITGVTGAGVFITLLWFSMPVLGSILIALATSYITLKRYIKYFKKAREGFVWHYLYSKGFVSPVKEYDKKEDYENSLIPHGFENEFVN